MPGSASLLFALAALAATASDAASPLAQEIQAGVDLLASDALGGRGLGSAGIRKAADWLERELKKSGFGPAFGTSYRQRFQVKSGVARGKKNRLVDLADADWTPLGFSSSGAFSGELVFAGYGLDAPSVGYRELDGLDLRGKVVLMLRYEPQERDDASPFAGRRPSRWSAPRYKVLQARERGAVAVIFVTGPLQDEGKDKIPALKNDGPESPAGLPVVQVKTSVARRWLAGRGIELGAWQAEVDRNLLPTGLGDLGVRIDGEVDVTPSYVDAENVGGVLPGRGALAAEALVIGAHYDHLGWGGERSMRPNAHAVHNGADDNASGTVAALLLGRALGRELANAAARRSLFVTLFSGEEVGLAGSAHFVAAPPVPIERIAAMLNFDMVGALRDHQLIAYGTESAREWPELVARARGATPSITITSRGDGYGPSDQTSFYAAGVPVLFFFTGQHERYHTPDDDPQTINAAGIAEVLAFSGVLGRELATSAARPTYQKASATPSLAGDSRGYGAYLGTVPDYRAMEAASGGVLLADVRTGGPADRAGLRGGDTIVEMAGTRIENLYDMTYALQDHRPGETITVVVQRAGARLALKATLGERGEERGPGHAAPAAAEPRLVEATLPAASPYYDDRPGADFAVGAGRPFAKTVPGEKHLRDIRQLTFGGDNAEAYFRPDGRALIFQATPPGATCDQQFVLELGTGEVRRVSSGKGRTTCGYYDWPEGDRIIYASTEAGGEACPPKPDVRQGYVWALYDSFDLYAAAPDGRDARRLTTTPGYDAEATWCPRGGKLVFTSVRDGDLELYSMDEAGEVTRLTHAPGYDGGAFYSPDCRQIVWRAGRPEGRELADYQALLAQGLVRPKNTEIFIAAADGSAPRQLTQNGAANFCPYFSADGQAIIFTSNMQSGGQEFDLFRVPSAGGTPERITFAPSFDGFPVFSPDGRYLVWASNRASPTTHETNLFIARWQE